MFSSLLSSMLYKLNSTSGGEWSSWVTPCSSNPLHLLPLTRLSLSTPHTAHLSTTDIAYPTLPLPVPDVFPFYEKCPSNLFSQLLQPFGLGIDITVSDDPFLMHQVEIKVNFCVVFTQRAHFAFVTMLQLRSHVRFFQPHGLQPASLSVHRTSQASILECVAIPFFMGSSRSRD